MAIIEVNRIIDTVLTLIQAENIIFNTILDYYYENESVSFFKGIHKSIPSSNLPSIELGPMNDTPSWHSCRVQEDSISLELHLTTSATNVEAAVDLEGKLVCLITRILTFPPHLRAQIQGTQSWLFDSFVTGVEYGSPGYSSNIRVSKIGWNGKVLNYITDNFFPPFLQGGGSWGLG